MSLHYHHQVEIHHLWKEGRKERIEATGNARPCKLQGLWIIPRERGRHHLVNSTGHTSASRESSSPQPYRPAQSTYKDLSTTPHFSSCLRFLSHYSSNGQAKRGTPAVYIHQKTRGSEADTTRKGLADTTRKGLANTAAYLRCPVSRGFEYDKIRKDPAPCLMCPVSWDLGYDDKVRKVPLATAAPTECLD